MFKLADPPRDERARLAALRATGLLDTPAEERFDRITRLARALLDMPIALVGLVDGERQWFKSAQGMDVAQTPRDMALCARTIAGDGLLAIGDTTLDASLRDDPLVTGAPHVRAYAGAPLRTPGGHAIGTLCVIDRRVRTLDTDERLLLIELARLAEREIVRKGPSSVDPDTRLSNRAGFEALAQLALDHVRRRGRPVELAVIELTDLTAIERERGADDTARAVYAFARMFGAVFARADAVGRIDTDAFAAIWSRAGATTVFDAFARLRAACDGHAARSGRRAAIRWTIAHQIVDPESQAPIGDWLATLRPTVPG